MRGFGVFLWQEWRQSAKGVLLIAATLLLCALLLWRWSELILYIFSKNNVLVISMTYLPAIGAAVLMFLQENRGRVGFSYNRRMLVLPVYTWVLVAAPLVYRLVLSLLFALCSGLICLFIKELYYLWPQALMLGIGVCAAHALIFLSCGYGNATGLALFVLGLVLTYPGVRIVLQAIELNLSIPSVIMPDSTMPEVEPVTYPAAVACMVFWTVVAYWGARQARREVPEDPVGKAVRVAQRLTYFERDHTTFASPEAAQSWLEWRRGAYLFPWLSIGLGIVLTYAFQMPAEQVEMRFVSSFNLLAVAPSVIACLLGYVVTRGSSDYLWFVAARPLNTETISRARIRASLKAIAWAYGLLLIAFVITFKIRFPQAPIVGSLIDDLRIMTSTHGPYSEGLALLAFLSVVVVLTVWTLFWIARSAGVFVWGAGAIVFLWYQMKGSLYVVVEGASFVTPLTIFFWGMSGFLGIAAVITIVMGIRYGFMKLSTLGVMAVAWVLLTLAAHSLSGVLPLGNPIIVAACLLLPFVPFASIPLVLDWQRHR